MTIKEEFIAFYNEHLIMRDGAIAFLEYLNTTDFFEAPSSTKYHSCYEGGLAAHSLNVAKLLLEKNERFNLGYSNETLAICGLLHDSCKINYYKKADEPATIPQTRYLATLADEQLPEMITKNYASNLIEWYKNGKQGAKPEEKQGYVIEDVLPLGHGEKSIFLINRYIALTDDEAIAIRFHLAGWDPGVHFDYPAGFPYKKAMHTCKLLTALITADLESSNLIEDGVKI